MKLRIKGNTLRLRLTKSEVDYFSNMRFISEQTEFGTSTFSYSLRAVDQEDITATFSGNSMEVIIPSALSDRWTSTAQVGLSGEMEIGNGKKLYLLIEKDFKCLDETIEDQSDNYDNPAMKK